MIELKNIKKAYVDKKQTVEALKGISTVFPVARKKSPIQILSDM